MLLVLRRNLMPILLLFLIGFSIYAVNLNNKLFWDDDDWIVNNPYVQSLSFENTKFLFSNNTLAGIGLESDYYRPVLFLSFATNYALGQTSPIGYHLVNNILHILSAILIFFILFWGTREKIFSVLTALIFLIHPLQTEAVTYVAGRGDPLHLFLMLCSLVLFFRAEKRAEKLFSKSRIISLVALVLAILSQEKAIVFPFLALITFMTFIRPGRFFQSLKEGLKRVWPYFGLVFIYGLLRLTVLNFGGTLNFYQVSNVYSESLAVRMFTFLSVLITYFRLLFAPIGLHMERSSIVYTSLLNLKVFGPALVLLGLLILPVFLYRRKMKDGAHPKVSHFDIWFFGLGWFFIALGPVSGLTPINAVIYEHWLYVPMIGFFSIPIFYLAKLINFLRAKSSRGFLAVLIILLSSYGLFFSAQAIKRNILWGNAEAFYQDILSYEPDSVRINNNLGNISFNKGDLVAAKAYYAKATEAEDVFPQPYFNLGSILQTEGDIVGAIMMYERALAINPNFHYALQNLVELYAQQGDLALASDYIGRLKKIRPTDPVIFYNSALVNLATGNQVEAETDLEWARRYAPAGSDISQLILELQNRLRAPTPTPVP